MTAQTWKRGDVLLPAQLTPLTCAAIMAALTDAQALAITAWREAEARFVPDAQQRGDGRLRGRWEPNPPEAMADILNVVDNRARDRRWARLGHRGIVHQHSAKGVYNFSCWQPDGGPDDPRDADELAENFEAVMRVAQQLIAGVQPVGRLAECLRMAEDVLAGRRADALGGACHYFAEWIAPPYWATHESAREVCRRHGHVFMAGVP